MEGRAHIINGTALGLTTGIGMAIATQNVFTAPVVLMASSVFSILPDIDIPESKAGKCMKPVSKLINKVFGHRTITHSWYWVVVAFAIYTSAINKSDLNNIFASAIFYGAITGFCSHLLCDLMTKRGIPILWPLVRKTIHITNIKSGKHDFLLGFIVFLAWNAIFFIIFLKNISIFYV